MGSIALTLGKIVGMDTSVQGTDVQGLVRASKMFAYQECEFYGPITLSAAGGRDADAVLFINKGTVVGLGGAALSLNVGSSTLTFAS